MKKLRTLLMLLALLLPASVFAQEEALTLSSDKPVYEPRDIITVTATVTNPFDYGVTATITSLLQDVSEEGVPYMVSEAVELKAQETREVLIQAQPVREDMPDGKYFTEATLSIGEEIFSDSVFFMVTGTKDYVSLDVSLCTDAECENMVKVFALGEPIYVKMMTEPEDANVVMAFQGRTYDEKLVKLEGVPVGSYSFTVKASRGGYLERETTDMFAIIEEHAEIPYVGKCDGDFECDEGESHETCPLECAPEEEGTAAVEEEEEEEGTDSSALGGGIAILVLLAIAAFLLLRRKGRRRRRTNSSKFHP